MIGGFGALVAAGVFAAAGTATALATLAAFAGLGAGFFATALLARVRACAADLAVFVTFLTPFLAALAGFATFRAAFAAVLGRALVGVARFAVDFFCGAPGILDPLRVAGTGRIGGPGRA